LRTLIKEFAFIGQVVDGQGDVINVKFVRRRTWAAAVLNGHGRMMWTWYPG